MSPAWLVPDWPAPGRVRALSTLRGGGDSSGEFASLNLGDHVGDDPGNVVLNRRRLRVAARLPSEPVWLRQVHGTGVANLDAADGSGPTPTADAAVTRRSGVVCAVLTADCLPVLFTTVAGDRIAAAHAGWRGLAAGVLLATLRCLAVPPGQVLAWIGPGIGPRHYEVGTPVREAFDPADRSGGAADPAFVPTRPGHFRADLPALARRQLCAAGVGAVHGGEHCTFADPDRFFSHRRDGRTGRQATLIWLE